MRTGSSDRVSALIFVPARYAGPPARAVGQKGGRSEMLCTTEAIPRLSRQRGSAEGAAGLPVWEPIGAWFRFRDWPSARGRWGKKGNEILHGRFSCRWQPASRLFVQHVGKNSMSSSDSPSDCNASFKRGLFACSPYKNISFPALVFPSAESGHRRSLAGFSRGSLLTNLYSQRTPHK